MQGKEDEKPRPKKISFSRKHSEGHLNEEGQFQRPFARIPTQKEIGMTSKLHDLMANYIPKDIDTIQKQIVGHVEYTLARTRFNFKTMHCYQAVAHSVRDRLIESFNDSYRTFKKSGKKCVYYVSLEFLIGRCLGNALINLNLETEFKEALTDLGYSLENIESKEVDPALGNGGLGRLAACFLDSLATLEIPAWGYGIRYNYGIFRQAIQNGYQIEVPDFWLAEGNPWEIQRLDVQYKVKFYGKTTTKVNTKGQKVTIWEDYETILARAYDTPIPGYATFNTIGLRLWRSLPINEFDLGSFNSGEYYKSLEERQKAEYITSVLYPNDSTEQGKELRLKQQYLLVSATLQDIIRRHKSRAETQGMPFEWNHFPKEAAIQLNDTHPALAIAELLRILLDEQKIDHEAAWEIVYNTFSYTNHTVLPQALEKWTVDLLQRLLPRHLELIYLINHFWLEKVKKKFPNNEEKLSSLSLVEEGFPKRIKMANLSIVGSHKVNGVARLHTELVKTVLFKDFTTIFPDKFVNMTNGVTVRRWILKVNPLLAELYTEFLKSDEWVLNMDKIRELEPMIEKEEFRSRWRAIKRQNKVKLASLVLKTCNIEIDPDSMFDIQVKRIHEYKRQFMNILYVIYRYRQIKEMKPEDRKKVTPRTVMFSGKAAPAYHTAKTIIKLISAVSDVVNNDKVTSPFLKVVFIPNYNVSSAQVIIPASDLSEHISTAGTEASGTSNMKFVLNGGLIVGTMDGANVEIHEEVGDDNIFIFGARVEAIEGLKTKMSTSSPDQYIPEELKKVLQIIREGVFGDREVLMGLVGTITNNNDWYLVSADFCSYIEIQEKIDKEFQNVEEWTKKSIRNSLRNGKFSSDRTIKEYAKVIWDAEPCHVATEGEFELAQ